MEKSGIQKALEEAIRFEVDGREFFLQAAETAETYFTKSIFKVLAEEELSHIQRVKEVHRRCLSSEKDIFLLRVPIRTILGISSSRRRERPTRRS
jgi:rubrerythrin